MKAAVILKTAITNTDNRKESGDQDAESHSSTSNISDRKIAWGVLR